MVGAFKLQTLTAFVEKVQLQNITGTHFPSLTNNILKFGVFGDNCWPGSFAECIFFVVHHRRVVVRDSVGGGDFVANSKVVLHTLKTHEKQLSNSTYCNVIYVHGIYVRLM